MPIPLPAPPPRTVQETQEDVDQVKVYLDVLRRLIQENLDLVEGAAISKSIIDAKGDLIVGTADDTPVRVAVGANRTILEADSAASPGVAWVARALGLKSVQVFTGSGTWTRPTGIRKVVVAVQGGGGGGGGVASAAATDRAAGGGGGGGYATKLLDVSAIASSTITVGAGGAGGAAGANNGVAGGNSSWADGTNTVTGNGGNGGNASADVATAANLGGDGGGGTGGDFAVHGAPAGLGLQRLDLWYQTGRGGDSHLGAGAREITAAATGGAGSLYGGGGGGALGNNANRAGGAGAAGIVVVYEYE